jgi:hypothetical protein
MSHSQFHSTTCLYLDMHGLIFRTSIWLLAGSTRYLILLLSRFICVALVLQSCANCHIPQAQDKTPELANFPTQWPCTTTKWWYSTLWPYRSSLVESSTLTTDFGFWAHCVCNVRMWSNRTKALWDAASRAQSLGHHHKAPAFQKPTKKHSVTSCTL